MRKRVHIFTTDLTPHPSREITIPGLRSHQLIQSMKAANYDLTYSVPNNTVLYKRYSNTLTEAESELVFDPSSQTMQGIILDKINPDYAVWCNLFDYNLPRLFKNNYTMICDLGETALLDSFSDDPGYIHDIFSTSASRLADFSLVLFASQEQKLFFTGPCITSGLGPNKMLTVPCSMDNIGEPPDLDGPLQLVFIEADHNIGHVLPMLKIILQSLDHAIDYRLNIFIIPSLTEKTIDPKIKDLERETRVNIHYETNYAAMLKGLKNSHLALNLVPDKLKYDLASGILTALYLAHGLPVLTSGRGNLDRLIVEHGGGLRVDFADLKTLAATFRQIEKQGKDFLFPKSEKALKIIGEIQSPARAISPLFTHLDQSDVKQRSPIHIMKAKLGQKTNLRVLAITLDNWAIKALRLTEPFLSLQFHELIEGFTIINPFEGKMKIQGPVVYNEYDVLWIQREACTTQAGQMLINLFDTFALDVDDLIIETPPYSQMGVFDREIIFAAINHASVISISTRRLFENFQHYSGINLYSKALLTPNGIRFPSGSRDVSSPPKGLIWTSSDYASLGKSTKPIISAINTVSEKNNMKVYTIGLFSEQLQRQLPNSQYLGKMDFYHHKSFLASSTPFIGLAPLETDCDDLTYAFISSKSDLKMIEYGGNGHPGLYSAAPPYLDSPVKTGRIVENTFENWRDGLEELLKEGYKVANEEMKAIRETRHIDIVSIVHWLPVLENCVVSEPIKLSVIESALNSVDSI